MFTGFPSPLWGGSGRGISTSIISYIPKITLLLLELTVNLDAFNNINRALQLKVSLLFLVNFIFIIFVFKIGKYGLDIFIILFTDAFLITAVIFFGSLLFYHDIRSDPDTVNAHSRRGKIPCRGQA